MNNEIENFMAEAKQFLRNSNNTYLFDGTKVDGKDSARYSIDSFHKSLESARQTADKVNNN